MAPMVIVAIISLCGTMFGSIAGIMTANKLTIYRIEQLEKKVDKHNNAVERIAILELEEETVEKRIEDIAEMIEKYHSA